MSYNSSCTLAAMFGAAVGAGVTYMMLKDKEELEDNFEDGMKTIDKVFGGMEVGVERFFDSVERSMADTKPNPDNKSSI